MKTMKMTPQNDREWKMIGKMKWQSENLKYRENYLVRAAINVGIYHQRLYMTINVNVMSATLMVSIFDVAKHINVDRTPAKNEFNLMSYEGIIFTQTNHFAIVISSFFVVLSSHFPSFSLIDHAYNTLILPFRHSLQHIIHCIDLSIIGETKRSNTKLPNFWNPQTESSTPIQVIVHSFDQIQHGSSKSQIIQRNNCCQYCSK